MILSGRSRHHTTVRLPANLAAESPYVHAASRTHAGRSLSYVSLSVGGTQHHQLQEGVTHGQKRCYHCNNKVHLLLPLRMGSSAAIE